MGHFIENHPVCGHRHGHTLTVRVQAPDEAVASFAVTIVTREFTNRDFGEMLPGGEGTLTNLAAYLHERVTGVSAVEAWFDHAQGVRLEW